MIKIRIRPEGWFVLFLFPVLFFAAMNVRSGWLFTLDFSLMGIALSSLIIGYLAFRGKISAKRNFTESFEGESVPVHLFLKNTGRLNQYLLTVDNVKFIPYLERNHEMPIRYSLSNVKRGVYPVADLPISGSTLGNFFTLRKTLSCPGMMIVYPRSRPFDFRALISSGSYQNDAGIRRRTRGGDDFAGIRDYEPGDDIRAIHWPSTAKTGRLQAREREETARKPFTLYIDDDSRFAGEPYERLIQSAAYALSESIKMGHSVRLYNRSEFKSVTVSEGLEILAGANPKSGLPLAKQLEDRIQELSQERELFIFTAMPEPDRLIFETLRQRSVAIHFLVFDR